jgi:hypothetical protein
VPLGSGQILHALGHAGHLTLGMLPLVEQHVPAEPRLRPQLQPPQRLDGRLRPMPQAGRLGQAVQEQERLDLLLD